MRIHDILIDSLKDQAGKKLTSGEIKQRVLQRYPDTKPNSILPPQHSDQARKGCPACRSQPIFWQLDHGLFKVREDIGQDFQPVRTIHEKLEEALAGCAGQVFSAHQLKEQVRSRFPETKSFAVTDHMPGGSCRDCSVAPLFERAGRGLFRFLESPHGPEPVPVLKGLTEQFGPDLRRQSMAEFMALLEGRLSQRYRREIHILAVALAERIPYDLAEFANLGPFEALLALLTRRICDNWGISEPLARWGVESWARALGAYQLKEKAPSVQEKGGVLPDPARLTAAGCPLAELCIRNNDTGYDSLLKGNRKIAMCLYEPSRGDYLLGIKAAHMGPEILSLLASALALAECPPAAQPRFSPHGRTDWKPFLYAWFSGVAREQMVAVFQVLDRQF